ncbi:MAG: hypothetical protein WD269_00425 [Acidimicrobiia bacterium]
MAVVAGALGKLEEDAQSRVLRWAADRYGVTVGKSGRLGGTGGVADKEDEITDQDITAEDPVFEHFADLFNACQPKTGEDKALVAAYWFQSVQGSSTWQSARLQKELKNLGHALPNIAESLSNAIKRKPARVLQLSKAGASKQARKTYKLTHEGLVYVQGMMAAATQ